MKNLANLVCWMKSPVKYNYVPIKLRIVRASLFLIDNKYDSASLFTWQNLKVYNSMFTTGGHSKSLCTFELDRDRIWIKTSICQNLNIICKHIETI